MHCVAVLILWLLELLLQLLLSQLLLLLLPRTDWIAHDGWTSGLWGSERASVGPHDGMMSGA